MSTGPYDPYRAARQLERRLPGVFRRTCREYPELDTTDWTPIGTIVYDHETGKETFIPNPSLASEDD